MAAGDAMNPLFGAALAGESAAEPAGSAAGLTLYVIRLGNMGYFRAIYPDPTSGLRLVVGEGTEWAFRFASRVAAENITQFLPDSQATVEALNPGQ